MTDFDPHHLRLLEALIFASADPVPASVIADRLPDGADIDALEQLILLVSAFAWEHQEVAELDLNPVIARPDGVLAVDARVVLAAEE